MNRTRTLNKDNQSPPKPIALIIHDLSLHYNFMSIFLAFSLVLFSFFVCKQRAVESTVRTLERCCLTLLHHCETCVLIATCTTICCKGASSLAFFPGCSLDTRAKATQHSATIEAAESQTTHRKRQCRLSEQRDN